MKYPEISNIFHPKVLICGCGYVQPRNLNFKLFSHRYLRQYEPYLSRRDDVSRAPNLGAVIG